MILYYYSNLKLDKIILIDESHRLSTIDWPSLKGQMIFYTKFLKPGIVSETTAGFYKSFKFFLETCFHVEILLMSST